MFLILMEKVLKRHFEQKKRTGKIKVNITIYETKQGDYPESKEEWDSYDGILIPGSFSAAYDLNVTDWIKRLAEAIQEEIHKNQRKTLGICFGHQIFAHSFGANLKVPNADKICSITGENVKDESKGEEKKSGRDWCDEQWGQAIPCPKGTQVGKVSFRPSKAGEFLLQPHVPESVSLYYTHGDMVKSLPSCAVCLGGNENVPIQSAAYFSSTDEARQFLNELDSRKREIGKNVTPKPYAFSFQAHLEMASNYGLHGAFEKILSAFEKNGVLKKKIVSASKQDAITSFPEVERDSVDVMLRIALVLGWI